VATPVHEGGGAGVPGCSRRGTERVGDEEERVYYLTWIAWLLVLGYWCYKELRLLGCALRRKFRTRRPEAESLQS
jgi:hypothetical protein